MIHLTEIHDTRQAIQRLFQDQCLHGAQSKALPDADKMAACGQFLGEHARTRAQRGMHGTAAAIGVLAESDDDTSVTLVRKLATYVSEGTRAESEDWHNRNDGNTIKISEQLIALSRISVAVAMTENAKLALLQKLEDGLKEGKGWGYFLDSPQDETSPLPTAFAVYALSAAGSRAKDGPALALLELLEQEASSEGRDAETDIYVHVFCLFVLTFSDYAITRDQQQRIKTLFSTYWRRLERLLSQDVEQTVEYWRSPEKNLYVRVPWQLYLLALAARLGPYRAFASTVAQQRLRSIIAEANGKDGFRYPHSGGFPSSRTNAILFEVLGRIQEELPKRQGYLFFNLFDQVRRFLGSQLVVWTVRIAAVLAILWILWDWYEHGATRAELAQHFVAYGLLFLMALGKGR